MMGFKHFGAATTIKAPYSRVSRWEHKARMQQKQNYDREQGKGKGKICSYGKRGVVQRNE